MVVGNKLSVFRDQTLSANWKRNRSLIDAGWYRVAVPFYTNYAPTHREKETPYSRPCTVLCGFMREAIDTSRRLKTRGQFKVASA